MMITLTSFSVTYSNPLLLIKSNISSESVIMLYFTKSGLYSTSLFIHISSRRSSSNVPSQSINHTASSCFITLDVNENDNWVFPTPSPPYISYTDCVSNPPLVALSNSSTSNGYCFCNFLSSLNVSIESICIGEPCSVNISFTCLINLIVVCGVISVTLDISLAPLIIKSNGVLTPHCSNRFALVGPIPGKSSNLKSVIK